MEENQDVKNFLVGKLKRALFVALFILTLTSCAGMGGLTQGGDKTKGPEKAERLLALLHEKVNKLRSFEAEYWVEGKSKSAFILLAVNRKRNYAVFKPIGGPNMQELPATIFDGGSNDQRPAWEAKQSPAGGASGAANPGSVESEVRRFWADPGA